MRRKVSKVTNQIHVAASYYRETTCKVRYFYADGTQQDVTKVRGSGTSTGGWGSYTYDNPQPNKDVIKIEIHLHSEQDGYEKDTSIHFEGGSWSRIVQEILQS